MKSVLYELYHDNIDPASLYEPLLKEHRNFLQRKFNSIDTLIEGLDKENPLFKEALDEILDFAFVEAHWDTTNAFMQGFSLGTRMMAEAYCLDLSTKD